MALAASLAAAARGICPQAGQTAPVSVAAAAPADNLSQARRVSPGMGSPSSDLTVAIVSSFVLLICGYIFIFRCFIFHYTVLENPCIHPAVQDTLRLVTRTRATRNRAGSCLK